MRGPQVPKLCAHPGTVSVFLTLKVRSRLRGICAQVETAMVSVHRMIAFGAV